jgi:hypothetical protein
METVTFSDEQVELAKRLFCRGLPDRWVGEVLSELFGCKVIANQVRYLRQNKLGLRYPTTPDGGLVSVHRRIIAARERLG